MGLKPRATPANIKAHFQVTEQTIRNAILNSLRYLGELCVNHARSVNTYRDQTGNLRNSIGYIITYNGQVVESEFSDTVATGTEGVTKGQAYAAELAGEIGQGWALIVVAGMNYALAVESHGLDVLTTSEQLAKIELPKLLADLKLDIAA